MKKIKSLVSLFALTLLATSCGNDKISVDVDDKGYVVDNGLAYSLVDDEYQVSYVGNADVTEISIPASVNNINVTKVSDFGFRNLPNLTKLNLPQTVKSIGKEAFEGDISLNTISVNNTVKDAFLVGSHIVGLDGITVGEKAFADAYLPKISLTSNNGEGNLYVKAEKLADKFDELEYSIKMNDDSLFKAEGKLTYEEIDNKVATIEVGAHGLFKQSVIKLNKNGAKVAEVALDDLAIYASHYNIAFLTATYPVTIFSLKAHEITENGKIPTYTYLERKAAFDWSNLQYNIHAIPTVSMNQFGALSIRDGAKVMADYVKELRSINKESTFTFYVTDLSVDSLWYLAVATRIPEDKYNYVMLSDGTATAAYLNRIYARADAFEYLDRQIAALNKVKDHLWTTGEFDIDYIQNNIVDFNPSDDGALFFFANNQFSTLMTLPNGQWWVNRIRANENIKAVADACPEFAEYITANKREFYANSLLAALTEEQAAAFKKLFHFDEELFKETRDANKKAMVMLGTSWSGEGDLYNYIKSTVLFYGSEGYDFYYKPHPGWPTSTSPERKVILDRLNEEGYPITEIDGAVAAEIIMYFNNDIYLSGYSSTTYASLDAHNKGMGGMEWGKPLSSGEYKQYMYNYLTPLEPGDPRISLYNLDSNKTYYINEYNDYDDSADEDTSGRGDASIRSEYAKHDVAIINLTDDEVTYFKGGSQVKADGSNL